MDENTCLPTGSEAPAQTSNDLPRALTEFGQQAEVSPSRWPVLGVAINQSAIALLPLFGRRLLKLDGEDLVGLRRINSRHFKIPVQVAKADCSRGPEIRKDRGCTVSLINIYSRSACLLNSPPVHLRPSISVCVSDHDPVHT